MVIDYYEWIIELLILMRMNNLNGNEYKIYIRAERFNEFSEYISNLMKSLQQTKGFSIEFNLGEKIKHFYSSDDWMNNQIWSEWIGSTGFFKFNLLVGIIHHDLIW